MKGLKKASVTLMKNVCRCCSFNPFDRMLGKLVRREGSRILLCWNRGLGDIPLGLYAMVQRIRQFIPHAQITVLTRESLREGFSLLEGVDVLVDPQAKRGESLSIENGSFDLILQAPDPTRWVSWQLGSLTPKLIWKEEWDVLHEKFALDRKKRWIGVQVHSETVYGYEKNWPEKKFRALFEALLSDPDRGVVLFGLDVGRNFARDGVVDLRGKTRLLEMLSIIKNCCVSLVVPDSGVLSMVYYIDQAFPLRVVSLWADPRQGVLKQRVASPNPLLVHEAILAPEEEMRNITVEQVLCKLLI